MRSFPLVLFACVAVIACGDDASSVVDAPPPPDDISIDAPVDKFQILADFDVAMGQLPEGVVVVNGVPFVSLAPRGEIIG